MNGCQSSFACKGFKSRLVQEYKCVFAAAETCPKLNFPVRTSNATVGRFYRTLGYVPDDVISFGKRLISDEAVIEEPFME